MQYGNPSVYSASDINLNCKKTFGELFRETQLKLTALKEHGFEVISIWESEFDMKMNEVKKQNNTKLLDNNDMKMDWCSKCNIEVPANQNCPEYGSSDE